MEDISCFSLTGGQVRAQDEPNSDSAVRMKEKQVNKKLAVGSPVAVGLALAAIIGFASPAFAAQVTTTTGYRECNGALKVRVSSTTANWNGSGAMPSTTQRVGSYSM